MTDVVVAFVDVGQGDCVVAVDRCSGDALLVDCPEGRHEQALAALHEHGAHRLQAAFITHQHLDHLGGVYSTVTSFPTSCVRLNPVSHVPADPDERKKLRAALRALHGLLRQNISLVVGVNSGDEGSVGIVQWQVLAPDGSQLLLSQADSKPNHASVVMRLSIGQYRVLLGSDADPDSWMGIIERNRDLKADVFQLPHHGADMTNTSNHLSLSDLLDTVQASYHVISVGSHNSYGHPSASTLAEIRARRNRAQTLCTQLNAVCAARTPGINVRCAGTIAFAFSEQGLVTSTSVSAHAVAIRRLPTPQCV